MNLRDCKAFIKANTSVPWFKLPDYRLNLLGYSERAIEEMCVNHLSCKGLHKRSFESPSNQRYYPTYWFRQKWLLEGASEKIM